MAPLLRRMLLAARGLVEDAILPAAEAETAGMQG